MVVSIVVESMSHSCKRSVRNAFHLKQTKVEKSIRLKRQVEKASDDVWDQILHCREDRLWCFSLLIRTRFGEGGLSWVVLFGVIVGLSWYWSTRQTSHERNPWCVNWLSSLGNNWCNRSNKWYWSKKDNRVLRRNFSMAIKLSNRLMEEFLYNVRWYWISISGKNEKEMFDAWVDLYVYGFLLRTSQWR